MKNNKTFLIGLFCMTLNISYGQLRVKGIGLEGGFQIFESELRTRTSFIGSPQESYVVGLSFSLSSTINFENMQIRSGLELTGYKGNVSFKTGRTFHMTKRVDFEAWYLTVPIALRLTVFQLASDLTFFVEPEIGLNIPFSIAYRGELTSSQSFQREASIARDRLENQRQRMTVSSGVFIGLKIQRFGCELLLGGGLSYRVKNALGPFGGLKERAIIKTGIAIPIGFK